MFSKKIVLFAVMASFSLVHTLTADDSAKVVGNITKKNVKDFSFGFGCGVVHGMINQGIKARASSADSRNFGYITTFSGSAMLEYTVDGADTLARSWGHGIGQCLAEGVNINEKGKGFEFTLNARLIIAALHPVLKYLSVAK